MAAKSAVPSEQKVLSCSIVLSGFVALLGIVFGILSGSQSIVFDGIFSIVDVAMCVLVLFVSRLVTRNATPHFQYGFWHFEPLVAVLNGAIMLTVCIYGFINSCKSLLSGGNTVELGVASVYAIVVLAACTGMYLYERKVNVVLKSEFISIDMKSCIMSGAITLALFLSFAVAEFLGWIGHAEFRPYADPAILMVITIGLSPIPIGILRRAVKEVFLIAPRDASRRIDEVMAGIRERHGIADYRAYAAKSGRIHVIDISILVPGDWDRTVPQMDAIRGEIAAGLEQYATLDRWLTIAFTTRQQWL